MGVSDEAAARAIGLSVFGKLPADLLARVVGKHRDVSVAPGYRFMGADHPAPYRTGLAVAGALLDQMVVYQRDMIHVLAGTAFGSIRQRVAMHLLNLGTTRPNGQLTAPVSQQVLADAVGSTRETVARALGELRDAGAIATQRNVIELRDPEWLAAEAYRATGV